MHRPRPIRLAEPILKAVAFCLALLLVGPAWAAEGEAGRSLQLEVSINGQPTKLITPFTDVAGKGLVTTRGELAELYIKPPGNGAADEPIALSSIPGLRYELNENTQSVNLIVGDAVRLRRTYDAASGGPPPTAGTADYGFVTNYNVFSSATQSLNAAYAPYFTGTNVSLDNRLITPYGVLSQTAIVGPNLAGNTETLRLETFATKVDPENLRTYRIGDAVTGGLSWTHPIRIAGAQLQHDYSFRPDLITASLPSVSGSAAVPSTVDVYINNVRTISQQVGAGPYQINNLPIYSGSGDARVVIRDASGKETTTNLSFFSTPRLLREGVYESSVEVGVPRLRYGIVSDDYEAQAVGAATLRMGMLDWLTAEAHAEGGLGLANGGVGLVAKIATAGIVNLAVSGSASKDRNGLQTYGSFDSKVGPVSFHASSQRALGGYDDLAAATARLRPSVYGSTSSGLGTAIAGSLLSIKQIRSLDGVSFSVPIEFDKSNISTSFLQAKTEDGKSSRIATLTYSRPLFVDANFYATAFHDFADAKATGVFVGITMPLGKTRAAPLVGQNAVASTNYQSSQQGHAITTDVVSSSDNTVGSWGWRIRDSEGTTPYREAGISHRTAIARLDANVREQGDGLVGRFQADGAVVAMGGNVYFSNRIEDGFGVVSAGAPGVKVAQDNRYVGVTDDEGKLLVPNLRSHHANRITIDPANLPIDAEVDRTVQTVTPAFRSGVYVDFKVNTSVQAAIVTFKKADGEVVPAGSEVSLPGDKAPHVVGYDGQIYLNNLAAKNTVTIKLVDGASCSASFDYVFKKGEQSAIGPVVCQ